MQLFINNNEIILFYNTRLPNLYYKINLTLFEILLSKHIYDTQKYEKYLDCFVRIFDKYIECQSTISNKVKISWIHRLHCLNIHKLIELYHRDK